jgi:hypothetical protein
MKINKLCDANELRLVTDKLSQKAEDVLFSDSSSIAANGGSALSSSESSKSEVINNLVATKPG